MAEFICSNNEYCSFITHITKVQYRNFHGNLIPVDLICPNCGSELIPSSSENIKEEINVDELSINVNRFASLNEKDKKEVIKKRAKKHFEKFNKVEVERKRNETIQNIKQKFEEGIK
jgi:uncharacterized Zn finger protein (UPF0148 family)